MQPKVNEQCKRKKTAIDQGSINSNTEDFFDFHINNTQDQELRNRQPRRQTGNDAAEQRRQNFQKQRQETLSISGYNENQKFNLNVREVNFSQISNNKSNVSNKSIDSVDNGTIEQSVRVMKQSASNYQNDQLHHKSQTVSPLVIETTSSNQGGQLRQKTSQNTFE